MEAFTDTLPMLCMGFKGTSLVITRIIIRKTILDVTLTSASSGTNHTEIYDFIGSALILEKAHQ